LGEIRKKWENKKKGEIILYKGRDNKKKEKKKENVKKVKEQKIKGNLKGVFCEIFKLLFWHVRIGLYKNIFDGF
jgi:hypothetical protein